MLTFPFDREHFEEAMKNACRSVSNQDIRCYVMFSQVHKFPLSRLTFLH
jgi:hypothetical protein